jgi:hypothetical protein
LSTYREEGRGEGGCAEQADCGLVDGFVGRVAF